MSVFRFYIVLFRGRIIKLKPKKKTLDKIAQTGQHFNLPNDPKKANFNPPKSSSHLHVTVNPSTRC